MNRFTFLIIILLSVENVKSQVKADFYIPDTVCLNTDFNIQNLSQGGTTFYWNFCSGNLLDTPIGENLGNTGGFLNGPVYVDFAKDGNDCYSFITNHWIGSLTRNYYGNSFSNKPVTDSVFNLGILPRPDRIEGIQIIKCNGKWYGLLAGGMHQFNIYLLNFGTKLSNTPTIKDLGNVNDVLNYPHTLYAFQENGNYYCLVGNNYSSTIVRIDFGNDMENIPTAVDLGNIGGLNTPVGFFPILDKGNWYLFVVNTKDNTISRINFGSSLTNQPLNGINLGSLPSLNLPRSITLIRDCGLVIGFVVNLGSNDIVRLTFPNGITSIPEGVSLGNMANFSFPHQISEVFRENDTLYTLIPNVNNNTLSRLYFPSCKNSSISSSKLKNPPPISYNSPGTYNINLTVDEGLPTQSNICKQIVVVALPKVVVNPSNITDICQGKKTILTVSGADTYIWSPSSGLNNTIGATVTANPVSTTTYTVTGTLNGCSDTAKIIVSVNDLPNANTGTSHSICFGDSTQIGVQAIPGNTYSWVSNPIGLISNLSNPFVSPTVTTTYTLTETVIATGCVSSANVIISVNPLPLANTGNPKSICVGDSTQIGTNDTSGNTYIWTSNPPGFTSDISNPTVNPTTAITYTLTETIINTGCANSNSVIINVNSLPFANAGISKTICIGGSTQIGSTAKSGNIYSWSSNPAGFNSFLSNPVVSPSFTTTYILTETIINTGCKNSNSIVITVNASPDANPGISKSICADSSIQLGLPPITGNSYSWTSNPPGFTSFLSNPVVSPDITTTYTLTETIIAGGCSKSNSIIITVNPLPIANAGSAKSICFGNSIQIGSSSVDGNSYSWTSDPIGFISDISDPVVSPSLTTTYTLTETINTTGCSNSNKMVVTVNLLPAIEVNPDSATICSGSSIDLIASGADKYSWHPSVLLNNLTGANVTANPSTTTIYNIIGTLNGCNDTISVLITVIPPPNIIVNPPFATICSGDSVKLSVSGGGSYSWFPDSGIHNISKDTVIVSPVSTTTYTISGSLNGCSNSENIIVTVNPLPVIILNPNPVSICLGDSIKINELGADSYKWFPSNGIISSSESFVIANPDSTTKYIVTGSSNGCSGTTNITITVIPKPKILVEPNPATICEGQSVSLSAFGADSFSWQPATALNTTKGSIVTASPLTTSVYTVIGSLSGCSDTLEVIINVNSAPVAAFSIDPKVISIFNPEADFIDISYGTPPPNKRLWILWNGDTLDSPRFKYKFDQTGKYKISLVTYNQYGCSDSISDYLIVQSDYTIFVPNAFNPENNTNSLFFAYGGGISDFRMEIYNRWGGLIFKTDNILIGWDGNYKGNKQPQGVYVYKLSFKDPSKNEHSIIGKVNLLR